MKLVAFGELLLRLDTHGHERFVQASQFMARYTGGEANVAVALAGWGHETFAVSKVPAHELGQSCIDALRRHGVNTDGVVRGGDRLGILFVESGASQRATRVIYDRQHSSFRESQPAEYDWDALLAGKDWLHFTGTAPALGASVLATLRDGLAAAKRLGVPVSFDCNYRSTLWTQDEARSVLPTLMSEVNVFVGSEHDAAQLFSIDGGPIESAAALRRRYNLRCVAYTLRRGENASVNQLAGLVCDGGGCSTSREYTMHVVDRVGGGDAFTAGLLHALTAGWDAPRTVEFATAAACLKHTIPGDFNLVTLDEVEHLVRHGEAGPVRR